MNINFGPCSLRVRLPGGYLELSSGQTHGCLFSSFSSDALDHFLSPTPLIFLALFRFCFQLAWNCLGHFHFLSFSCRFLSKPLPSSFPPLLLSRLTFCPLSSSINNHKHFCPFQVTQINYLLITRAQKCFPHVVRDLASQAIPPSLIYLECTKKRFQNEAFRNQVQ